MKEYLLKAIPVLLTLAMAWFFQNAVMGIRLPQPLIIPIPEEGGQDASQLLTPTPYLNSLTVVAAMFLGSVVIITLLRYKRVVRYIILTIFFTTSIAATTFYLLILTDLEIETILVLSTMVASLTVAAISTRSEVAGILAASYLSSSSGVIIGRSIPFWTSLVLLMAISIYDLLAVFKGHLKTFGQFDIEAIKGLVVEFRGVSIGFGDLFFYTVLYSFVASNFGAIPSVAALVGLLTGYILTLRLAKKKTIFPGLPITILTALAFSATVYLIL